MHRLKSGRVHIVDRLIEERAQGWLARPKRWALLRPFIYALLGYRKAIDMADRVANMSGFEAFSSVTDQVHPPLHIKGLENVPKTGAAIIIANHPTGLADGIYLFQALRERRPDMVFLANADALRVVPRADDIIIPVEWVASKRSAAKAKLTLSEMKRAVSAQRLMIIFPSGVPGKLKSGSVIDAPWMPTAAAAFARKHALPIIPLNIDARNSRLFYFLDKTNRELKDITLFHELLNKSEHTARLTFGKAIAPNELRRNPLEATAQIRKIVEALKG